MDITSSLNVEVHQRGHSTSLSRIPRIRCGVNGRTLSTIGMPDRLNFASYEVSFSALDLSYCVYNNHWAYVANGQVNCENRIRDRTAVSCEGRLIWVVKTWQVQVEGRPDDSTLALVQNLANRPLWTTKRCGRKHKRWQKSRRKEM